jgi:hypothetical protein
MRWDDYTRKYWDVGDRVVFRLSQKRCAAFLHALVVCDGQIHDTHSLDIHDGKIIYNMKPHECAVLFRISLPVGAEAQFEEIMGPGVLEEPRKVHLN